MMKVLSVASEIHPLVKTGGLADVAGALPPALAKHGVEVRTLVPGYPAIMARFGGSLPKPLSSFPDFFGGRARLLPLQTDGLHLIVLEAPHLFDRAGGPYGEGHGAEWHDNGRRFAAFARAGASIAGGSIARFKPDLVHVHDWQAALVPAYLHYDGKGHVPSVITIHNIAFQGRFPADILGSIGLPAEAMSIHGVEYYGGVGFLKAGLQFASAVSTVSPTYAQEIRTPQFGMGLEGLINARGGSLHGIVNGIDTVEWDPERDPHLAKTYRSRSLDLRRANRARIEERFGLAAGDGPLFCVISRLTWQKGVDLLATVLEELVAMGGRLAVLGSGDGWMEDAFRAGASRHPGRVGVVIGYDESLAHLLQGGADAIVVPSRFEPCGLTQLYGLRYGCVPVVSRTGGLADTVIDANEAALAAGVATGISFAPDNLDALRHALRRAVDLYRSGEPWRILQKNGMKADLSWDKSAARYAALFRSLVNPK